MKDEGQGLAAQTARGEGGRRRRRTNGDWIGDWDRAATSGELLVLWRMIFVSWVPRGSWLIAGAVL